MKRVSFRVPRVGLLALCLSLVVRGALAAPPNQSPSGTRVVLLGTGTPNPDPNRMGPAVAIVVDGEAYLVDCGAGVVRRAAEAHRTGIEALKVTNLKRVFVTHLHSDHTLGYADLILTPWVVGRDSPLNVHGPIGIRCMTNHLLAAYEEDIRVRIDGLEPANTTGYKVVAHEIEAGIVYTDSRVTVRAFSVRHGSWEHAFGFRFETPGRVVVVSGDTAPTPTLIDHAVGCDVLVHEVYSQAGFQRRPPEWQRYHARFHTSSAELARIASRVKPKLLILYHQLFWGTTEDELLQEIRAQYDGKVVSGRDLGIY